MPFGRHVCVDSSTPWVLGEHLPRRVAMLAVEFPKQNKASYKEPQRPTVGAAWPLALLAVVFSPCKKELAKNGCRPDTQNVAGHKEAIRGMGQAIGGGVRKAERGPNWYDL